MAVKLIKEDGTELTLNKSFRVDSAPLTRTVPAQQVEGRDIAEVQEANIAVNPRTVTVTGFVYDATREDAETERNEAMLQLGDKGAVKIFRHEDDEVYIAGRFVSAGLELHSAQTAIRLPISFRCDDPFWYRNSLDELDVSETEISSVRTIDNLGSYKAYPVIVFYAEEGAADLVNPQITNAATGETLQFVGSIEAGEALVIDTAAVVFAYLIGDMGLETHLGVFGVQTEELSEIENPTNVIGDMTEASLAADWYLAPGDNALTAEIDSGGPWQWQVVYRRRYL